MDERVAKANGIELVYETFGEAGAAPFLLIMGLGVQMLGWDEGFCRMLAARGCWVVRFDNRDVGRSTQIAATADLGAAMRGHFSGASYTLAEMAADAAGLLDALEVDAAHVVGASLGGMIGQTLAARHPQRVLSLTSIMSTTGDRSVGQPSPAALAVLMRRPATEREPYADAMVEGFRVIGSRDIGDPEAVRERALRSFDRGYRPDGTARQLMAILASGDRTAELRRIEAPTLVIHGEADPLIDVSGGRATAAAIDGAKLITIPGMGHDLPKPLWPRLVDAITENAARAKTAAGR